MLLGSDRRPGLSEVARDQAEDAPRIVWHWRFPMKKAAPRDGLEGL